MAWALFWVLAAARTEAGDPPFVDVFLEGPVSAARTYADASRDGRSVWLHLTPASFRIEYPGTKAFTSTQDSPPMLTLACRTGAFTGVVPARPLTAHLLLPMSPEQDDVPHFYTLAFWLRVLSGTAEPKHLAEVAVDSRSYTTILHAPNVDYSFARPSRSLVLRPEAIVAAVAAPRPIEIAIRSDGGDAELAFQPDPDGVVSNVSAYGTD